MSYQRRGFVISCLVHAVVVSLLLTIVRLAPTEPNDLLVIDFSITPSPGPASRVTEPEPSSAGPAEVAASPAAVRERVRKAPAEITEIKPDQSKAVVPPPPKKPAPDLKPEAEPEPEPAPEPEPEVEPANQRVEQKTDSAMDRKDVAAETLEPLLEPLPVAATAAATDNAPTGPGSGVSAAAGDADAVGRTSSGAAEKYVEANFQYIMEDIQQGIVYPRMARRMGWEGTAVISFVVCETGAVEDIQIVESSGYSLLDENAVKTIKKTAPFPSPPVRAVLVVPVTYRLG